VRARLKADAVTNRVKAIEFSKGVKRQKCSK
jgi:hypothetical protein